MSETYEKWTPPEGFKWIYGSLLMSMLLGALDQTIISTALPTMVGELNGVSYMAWVITSYILASTISMPIYGKLGDLMGRRTMMLTALSIFLLGSTLGGFSQNIEQLIAFRGLQGLGGGGLMVLTQATLADLVPIRERSKYMAPIGMMFAIASIAGPLIGGYLTDYVSWRWTFWINLPIGLTVITIVWKGLRLSKPDKEFTLDISGTISMVFAVCFLTLFFSWGGTTYAWVSPQIIGLGLLTVISSLLFLYAENRAKDPIIPMSLFHNATFNITTLLGLLVGIGMFASIAYMPTYFQMVYGYSAIASGYLMIPMMLGIIFTINLTGQLAAKSGYYKKYPLIGLALCAFTLFLFSTLEVGQPVALVCLYIFMMGAGVGCTFQILILAVQNSVPFNEVGTATSANAFFREIGATMGIAIVGSLFSARLTSMLTARLSGDLLLPIDNIESITPAILRAMPEAMQDIFINTYADALTPIFLYIAPVFICGIILGSFLPNNKLEQKKPNMTKAQETDTQVDNPAA
ncbi:MFS transporter [Gammaproteobacteria bacterium]|nr:MFS transporter [Gammaproteobacteria bacterium]